MQELMPWIEKHPNYSKVQDKVSTLFPKFAESKIPTTKLENWKYTALSKFIPTSINLMPASNENTPVSKNLTEIKELLKKLNINFSSFTENQLIFLNGQPIYNALDNSIFNSSEFNKTSEAFSRGPEDTLEELNVLSNILNTEKRLNFALDHDLDIIYLYSESASGHCLNPEISIEIPSSKKVNLFEQHIFFNESESSQKAISWSNPTFSINVQPNSQVFWNLQCSLNSNSIITARKSMKLERDSQVHYAQNIDGGKLSRIDLIVDLQRENSNASLKGFYHTKNAEHHDTTLLIRHNKSHTFSSQLFKGILRDNSRAVFNGLVEIAKDAQKVDAKQLNKNIILGDKAHVDTRPQLIVSADDVKAAHGATIGQLDPEESFYLQSRGIHPTKANQLLLKGFGSEVFEEIQNSDWKEYITAQNNLASNPA